MCHLDEAAFLAGAGNALSQASLSTKKFGLCLRLHTVSAIVHFGVVSCGVDVSSVARPTRQHRCLVIQCSGQCYMAKI